MGSLYKRGGVWWIKYYRAGRPIRESTGIAKKKEAENILKEREGRVATGAPIIPRADKIRYDEAAEDLRQHYQTTGSRRIAEAEKRLKRLDVHFRGWRIAAIGPAEITAYAATRQGEGMKNSTVNRELGVLSRMLRLAYENSKLLRMPVIRLLKEPAARSGFFEQEQYAALQRHLRPELRVACEVAYVLGWRMRAEVLTLERRHLDLEAGTLRIDPGASKNDDGRVVYLPPEVKASLAAQVERVRQAERQQGRIIKWLFPYLEGRRAGERIKDFRKAWATACRKAGVPGMLKHDFRRTAVRNMVNRGIPERVAMKISGHRTRSVFDRYHIVSPGDLQDAAKRLTGTKWAQSRNLDVDTGR